MGRLHLTAEVIAVDLMIAVILIHIYIFIVHTVHSHVLLVHNQLPPGRFEQRRQVYSYNHRRKSGGSSIFLKLTIFLNHLAKKELDFMDCALK